MLQLNLFLTFTFLSLFLLSGFSSCGSSQKDGTKEQILTYLLNTQTASGNPCMNFANSENSCVISPDSVVTTCSESEISRLTNLIEPSEKRTSEIMNAFFQCWNKCNLLFNAGEPICTKGTKFSSNREYRSAQRSGSTSASQTWGVCMNSCNKGESVEEGLSTSGATYPKPAY